MGPGGCTVTLALPEAESETNQPDDNDPSSCIFVAPGDDFRSCYLYVTP